MLNGDNDTNISTLPEGWTQENSEIIHLAKDSGDAWFEVNVDLAEYKGDRVRLKFDGTTGTDWASDR